MPLGPVSGGRGSGPAPSDVMGVPAAVVPGGSPPDQQAMSEIIQMLRGGQVGAERFMELLSLLAASSLPQMQQGEQPPQQGGGSAIQQALGG